MSVSEAPFSCSDFEGNVVGNYNDTLAIQYVDLVVTKDGPQLVEMIGAEHVRPYPPHIDYDVDAFEKGDVVDVWYKDGWWDGVIQDVFYNMNNHKRYEVFFDYMSNKKNMMTTSPQKSDLIKIG